MLHFREAFSCNLSFRGRANRKKFWTFTLVGLAILVPLVFIGTPLTDTLFTVCLLGGAVVWAPLTVRRLHDADRSGWWLLAHFLPPTGQVVLFFLTLKPSDPWDNQYGRGPRGPPPGSKTPKGAIPRRRFADPIASIPEIRKPAVHGVLAQLVLHWSETDVSPASPMEGASPQMTRILGVEPIDFTFDAFRLPTETAGWRSHVLELPGSAGRNWRLHLPVDWCLKASGESTTANAIDAKGRVRQSIFLLPKERWREGVPEFLDRVTVEGFNFQGAPGLEMWVFVTGGEPRWVWGVFSGGKWVILIKGDAKTREELELQVISLINADPWQGWISAGDPLDEVGRTGQPLS